MTRRFLRFATAGLVLLLMVVLPVGAQEAPVTPQVPDASQFVGAPKGVALQGEALERRTNEVGGLLRCPVCQGLSVADSPAEMAVNMKGQVRDLLARGYTEEQILSYFEQSYGQFVLLRPKFEGVNILVWIFPAVAFLIGAAVVVVKMRKLEKEPVPTKPAAGSAATPPVEDDPYLARVRQMVGGEKS